MTAKQWGFTGNAKAWEKICAKLEKYDRLKSENKELKKQFRGNNNLYSVTWQDLLDIITVRQTLNLKQVQTIKDNINYITCVIEPELNNHLEKVLINTIDDLLDK